MGYIKHNAIVVTSYATKLSKALLRATEIGLQVIGPSDTATNGYCSILICPDGSKEGWNESDDGDVRRQEFIDWLNEQAHEDGSSDLEWAEIAYGTDDGLAQVVNSAWDNQANLRG